jgi:hypothetical protein
MAAIRRPLLPVTHDVDQVRFRPEADRQENFNEGTLLGHCSRLRDPFV